VALAAFEEAGAHRRLGYGNLFDYLHRELLLPRSSAHYRKVAARLLRRFPGMVEPLRDGRLCLSTVIEVEKVLTEENQAEVLPRFFGLSRQEAKELVANVPTDRDGASKNGRHPCGNQHQRQFAGRTGSDPPREGPVTGPAASAARRATAHPRRADDRHGEPDAPHRLP
jgi:hypothetical protein